LFLWNGLLLEIPIATLLIREFSFFAILALALGDEKLPKSLQMHHQKKWESKAFAYVKVDKLNV